MGKVYVVHHEYEGDAGHGWTCAGVYPTEQEAEAAISRLKSRPGFRFFPDGFDIVEFELGEVPWESGFSIMCGILLPLPDRDGEFIGAEASWHPGERYKVCSIDDGAPPDLGIGVGDYVSCRSQMVDDCEELVADSVVETAVVPWSPLGDRALQLLHTRIDDRLARLDQQVDAEIHLCELDARFEDQSTWLPGMVVVQTAALAHVRRRGQPARVHTGTSLSSECLVAPASWAQAVAQLSDDDPPSVYVFPERFDWWQGTPLTPTTLVDPRGQEHVFVYSKYTTEESEVRPSLWLDHTVTEASGGS